jgi:hypothetical protein
MSKVAFATYHKLHDLTEDDRLVLDHLHSQGVETQAVLWDSDQIRWEEFESIILRSCWEYHLRPQAFSSWVGMLAERGIPLWNPPQVVHWNMDKMHLRGLAEAGVAVPTAVWLDKGSGVNLEAILEERNWQQAVIKPTISMTAFQTWITTPQQAKRDQAAVEKMLKRSGVMIQKFIDEVRTRGEWSFIFFWKTYSHAVLKRAKQGDFRVQNDFGGYLEKAAPSVSLIEQAQKIVDSVAEPLLYARVDGIDVDGTLVLMELELIDPVLFLGEAPHAPQSFADAIMATILGNEEKP